MSGWGLRRVKQRVTAGEIPQTQKPGGPDARPLKWQKASGRTRICPWRSSVVSCLPVWRSRLRPEGSKKNAIAGLFTRGPGRDETSPTPESEPQVWPTSLAMGGPPCFSCGPPCQNFRQTSPHARPRSSMPPYGTECRKFESCRARNKPRCRSIGAFLRPVTDPISTRSGNRPRSGGFHGGPR
jgi:hypothetical protein